MPLHGSINISSGDGVPFLLRNERRFFRLIAEYAETKGLVWIDLFTATAEDGTRQLSVPYSNDGLHLTTAGYRLLARLLYDQLFAKLFVPKPGLNL